MEDSELKADFLAKWKKYVLDQSMGNTVSLETIVTLLYNCLIPEFVR